MEEKEEEEYIFEDQSEDILPIDSNQILMDTDNTDDDEVLFPDQEHEEPDSVFNKDISNQVTNEHINDHDDVPVVEVDDVEKNDNWLIGGAKYVGTHAPPDMAKFAVSPKEWTAFPKGVIKGVANISEFMGDLDRSSWKYLGVYTWGGDRDNKWEFSDMMPQWIPPWRTEELKKYYTEEYEKHNTFYALSRMLHKQAEVLPEQKTGSGVFTEEIGRYLTGLKGMQRFFNLKKRNRSWKQIGAEEMGAGVVIFGGDEDGLGDVLKQFGVNVPDAFTYAEWDEPEEKWVRRALGAFEGVTTGILLEGKFYKSLSKLFKWGKVNEKAINEQATKGKVSEETAKELEDATEEVENIDTDKVADEVKSWKLKDGVVTELTETEKRIERAKQNTALRNDTQKNHNEGVAKRHVGYYNDIIKDYEENLSINKYHTDGPKKSGDEGFFEISKMEGNKRVLDKDKVTQLRKHILEKEGKTLEDVGDTPMGDETIDRILDEDQIGDITADELEALSTRVLNTESIEALTTVAVELKKAKPELWKDSKSVMENIFTLSTMKELTIREDHPLWGALDKAGMSFEDFVTAHLGSATEAGKILQKYSTLSKRLKPKTAKQKKDDVIKKQGWLGTYFRRIENVRRGLLVSQIATAMRNLESGLIRSPVEALNSVIEVALEDIAQGKFAQNRAFKRTTWQDSFSNLRYIYSDRKLAEEYMNIIMKNPEMQKFNDQMFKTINEIQIATGRGSGTRTDKVLSKMEDFTTMLNAPNRWQDFMLRRATFMSEARRLFRQKWGVDLIEELENGRIKDIMRDSRDLNKTFDAGDGQGVSAVEIFAEATERALDITYASAPEVPMNKAIASFITNNNLTVAIPFPRFMFKSMELMAENSAGALIVPLRRIIPEGLGGQSGKLTQRDYRMISRNLTGGSAIMAASWLFGNKEQGEDYKLLKLDDGTMIDTTPLFPLRQYMFLGKMANNFWNASKDVSPGSAAKEAFFQSFPAREWIETFSGSNFRVGVAGNIVDDAAKLLTEQDITTGERLTAGAVEALSEYFASWAVPMNQVIDAQRALEARGTVYKDTAKDTDIFAQSFNPTLKKTFPFVGGILEEGSTAMEALKKPFRRLDPTGLIVDEESLPVKEDIFQDNKERKGSMYKVLGGINMYSEDSSVGKQLKSLGFTKWDLSSKSKIPTIKNYENKLIRKHLPDILKVGNTVRATAEAEYEKKRDNLSSGWFTGISKKQYVKMQVREKILATVNEIRGDIGALTALADRDKQTDVLLMLEYRKQPTSAKTKAWWEFKYKYGRPPFSLTEKELKEEYPNWDTLNNEEKDKLKRKKKQKELLTMGELAKDFARQARQ